MNTIEQLEVAVAYYRRLARANYYTVWALYVLSVGASIVATASAATGWLDKAPLALLTAFPGVVLMVTNTLKLNARCQWHYDKKRHLQALLRLAQSGAKATTPPEVAEKWNRIDEEMDKTWPGWGDTEKPKKPE
jgi:hypothetical protein